MSMTLEEAIAKCEERIETLTESISTSDLDDTVEKLLARNSAKCADEQRQLAEWLRELQKRRNAPEIIYCHECKHFQCNMRFDGSVPKGADAYECRHWCGGCDPMDYCSCGERAERRTDANNNLHV